MPSDHLLNKPLQLSGYVLAGGRSSRMGTDKATIHLRGLPLIQLALDKLRRTCVEVAILGNRPDLAGYAPTLRDRLLDAGPLAAIDTALHHTSTATTFDWLLLVPVDVPLLPPSLLYVWARQTLEAAPRTRARFFSVEGRSQPLVALLHRSLAPSVRSAVDRGERKVLPALEAAASPFGITVDRLDDPVWSTLFTPAPSEDATRELWFANSNTPEEFARIEQACGEADSAAASALGRR